MKRKVGRSMHTLKDIVIHETREVRLPHVSTANLAGVELFGVTNHTEPVLHLELIFKAGRVHALHPMVPVATASMLNEGTESRSSREIAEAIEFYGSTLRCNAGTDALSVSLYSMSKYFEESLEILEDILHNATFPEKELELYKQNRLHRLEIAQKKNDYIASTRLNGLLFGDHPYGYSATARDISSLSVHDLFGHYALLRNNNLMAFIAGDVKDRHLKALEMMLHRLGDGLVSTEGELPEAQEPQSIEIDGPQHHQCAVRMGRQVPTRDHADYPGLYFLNTVFGGYFGSRLMNNIREEKGLTYGISSSLETLGRAACLHISTEASGENKDVVLKEIGLEMQKLCQDGVDKREFEMVRNYIRGSIMMQLDGPFRVIDVVKTLVMECGTTDAFEDFMTGIRSATPESIQKLACKYLDWDDLHKVIVV